MSDTLLVALAAGAIAIALVAYAIFGGADFGGGIWNALAFGPRKREQRAAIEHAMGPVWEANHVWLIFAIVLIFSAFPRVFASLSIGLYLPLHLVLVGITLRGAAFAFRKQLHTSRTIEVVFGASSIVTPLLLGASLGAVSTGTMRTPHALVETSISDAWLSPLPIAMGFAALSLCAYQAAVFLAYESHGALREDFRKRALVTGTIVVAGATLTLPLLAHSAPRLWDSLAHGPARFVIFIGAIATLASGAALALRRFAVARITSSAQIALYLGGWAAAQYPYAIYPDLRLADAAAPTSTLRFVLATVPFGALLLVPSLVFLYRVFARAEGDVG